MGGLRLASDFARVHERGRKGSSDGVVVTLWERGDDGVSRVGLSVPRGLGTAVARNRTRRRLRHIARDAAPPRGCDVVLRAAPEAASLSYQELEKHVVSALTATKGRR